MSEPETALQQIALQHTPTESTTPVLPHPALIRVTLKRTGCGNFDARCYADDGTTLAYVTVQKSLQVDVAVWLLQEQDARYKSWEYFRAVEAEIAQRWGVL